MLQSVRKETGRVYQLSDRSNTPKHAMRKSITRFGLNNTTEPGLCSLNQQAAAAAGQRAILHLI